jgi:hypothetical protein
MLKGYRRKNEKDTYTPGTKRNFKVVAVVQTITITFPACNEVERLWQ